MATTATTNRVPVVRSPGVQVESGVVSSDTSVVDGSGKDVLGVVNDVLKKAC